MYRGVGLLATGLVLLVWVSAARPVDVVTGGAPAVRPSGQPSAAPSGLAPRPSARELFARNQPSADLAWVGHLLTAVAVGALLIGLAIALRWAWRNRWHPPEPPVVQDFDVLPEVARALVRDADAQLDAVLSGSPRNGIVACWLRLEAATAEAGLPRLRWETSSEFTVRVLKNLDLDPRAISELAGLYREARFSRHELGEEQRQQARTALGRLQAELRDLLAQPRERA